MKLLPLILISLFVGCSNEQSALILNKKSDLQQLWKDDWQKPVFWIYMGSDSKFHFFRRRYSSKIIGNKINGIYKIPLKELEIQVEMPYTLDSSKWKRCKQISSNGEIEII